MEFPLTILIEKIKRAGLRLELCDIQFDFQIRED